jgi:hypothetical protein
MKSRTLEAMRTHGFSFLSDAEQQINHELIEFFVWQSLLRQLGPVEIH